MTRSRSYIHTFDRSDFDQVPDSGRESVRRIAALVEQAEAEYRTRRRGLLVSVAAIGLLGIALYLKLRSLEGSQ